MTKKKVLIVDDDREASDLIRETLAPRGYEVFSCADPEEALARAGEIVPDLIFISILFPQSNGLKISRSVHAVGGLEKVPIVMLISYADELDPRYTSTIGIVDVALKPLKSEDILLKAASILGEGSAPGGIGAAGGSGAGEQTSLDEEWLSFLEKDDSKTAEASLSETPVEAGVVEEDRKPVDETEEFLLEGDRDKRAGGAAGDAVYEFEEGPKERPVKKFLAVAAAVLIAGAVVGSFLFFHGMQRKAAPRDARATAKKQQEVAVQKKESVPPAAQVSTPTAQVSTPTAQVSTPTAQVSTPTAVTQAKTESQAMGKKTVAEKPAAQTTAGKSEAGPAAVKQTASHGKTYSVQVGAFRNEKNAVALSEKLKRKGYGSFIKKDEGSSVNRVLIGKFDAPVKASVQARVIRAKEGLKSVIYRY